MTIAQFPHCDQRILHAPGECEFCDKRPGWQELRQAWGIAFTGHAPKASLPECEAGKEGRIGLMVIRPAEDPGFPCRRYLGHDGDHSRVPEWEVLPCPADAARPPGSPSDHRRWGGNKPTSVTGDMSWPAETAVSRVLYGDKGGRAPWPLSERIVRRMRRPFEDWAKRRRGWRKHNGFWRFPG